MPHYLIRITPSANADTIERLIRAPNRARALRKVTEDTIEIREAEPEDIARLTRQDVEIEVAADEPATVSA